jgi:hypothetical protein
MGMTAVRSLAGAVLLAAATVATWYAWLGRDTEYQVDAAGQASGPYTTAQVAGCVLTLAVLLAAAVLLGVHPVVAAATMTLAFTAAWTVGAADDETGLFLVGAILVLGGMAAGTTVVAVIASRLRRGRPAVR